VGEWVLVVIPLALNRQGHSVAHSVKMSTSHHELGMAQRVAVKRVRLAWLSALPPSARRPRVATAAAAAARGAAASPAAAPTNAHHQPARRLNDTDIDADVGAKKSAAFIAQ